MCLLGMVLFSREIVSDSLQPHGLQPAWILCLGFSRQEYWSGLPFPLPGDLPDPGIEPVSPALAGGFFTSEPAGKPVIGNVDALFDRYPGDYLPLPPCFPTELSTVHMWSNIFSSAIVSFQCS